MSAELIERLEKATGPDRYLDRAILDAFGAVVKEFDPGDGNVSQWREWSDGTRIKNTHVTESIDAALTLVPDGWAWALLHHRDCSGANAVPLAKISRASWNKRRTEAEFYKEAHSRGSTPAIALCIATLKIRALTTGDQTK